MTRPTTPRRIIATTMEPPENSATNGRDEKGRWLKGHHGGPGRPRRIDVIRAAKEYADKNGVDLDEAIGAAVVEMLTRAKDGDVAAFRAVVDRLCGPVKLELEAEHKTAVETPDIPKAPGELRGYFEKMADIAATLDREAARVLDN